MAEEEEEQAEERQVSDEDMAGHGQVRGNGQREEKRGKEGLGQETY